MRLPGAVAGGGLLDLPAAARAFVLVTTTVGLACVAYHVPHLGGGRPLLLGGLLGLGLLAATIQLPLPLARGASSMSVAHTVVVFTMLAMGTEAALLVAIASSVAQSTVGTRGRTGGYKVLFNVATLAVTVTLAGATFFSLRADHGSWLDTLAGPLMCAELVYFFTNTALVASAVALTSRRPLIATWLADFIWTGPGYFVSATAAAAGVLLTGQSLLWWAATATLLYLTYRSYRTYADRVEAGQLSLRQALDTQFAVVRALTGAIESKDQTSQLELHRLTMCTEALGQAAGLDEPELVALRTAALLHDIGNLAVPEHVLAKSDALTFEEYERVKIHPRVGAEILKSVPFSTPVTPIILGHHERWDGSGYPDGLKGSAIPLGARILAVADCFTSLLSARPYRPAVSYWEALATLKRCGGTWLDPVLVETFVELLPQIEPQLQRLLSDASRVTLTPHTEFATERAFQHIAGARHEARALFEIAQALTSTQGVNEAVNTIVDKLSELIPIRAGALFLWSAEEASLSCRYATGPDKETLLAVEAGTIESVRAQLEHGAGSEAAAVPQAAVLTSWLRIGDRPLGALVIVGRPTGARLEHQRLLEHVAPQVALVIHNALAFEETRQLSLTDPMTELPNRRYLVQHLGIELARADRHGRPVALLLMDVNDFKDINDTFGHRVGDQTLCEVGRVMQSLLRPYDVCARFGGDEFVLVLWDCDARQAESRRQQIEETVAQTRPPVEAMGSALPSVSIGIAVYPDDGRSTELLLASADQRMYARKARRRAAAFTHSALESA